LIDAELKVVKLVCCGDAINQIICYSTSDSNTRSRKARQRENLESIRNATNILLKVQKLSMQCNEVESPLSQVIKVTGRVLHDLLSSPAEYPVKYVAIDNLISLLKMKLLKCEGDVYGVLMQSLVGPTLDEDAFDDALLSYANLNKSPDFSFNAVCQASNEVFELIFHSDAGDNDGDATTLTLPERPFLRLSNACNAFSQMKDAYSSGDKMLIPPPGTTFETFSVETLKSIEQLAETYLKSPVVRSLSLDEFGEIISDAIVWMDSIEAYFGSDDVVRETRQRFEASIRLRAMTFAQQYQAEGFQAMRGFLWREMWVKLDDDSGGGDAQSFGEAIIKRLGGVYKDVDTNNNNNNDGAKQFSYVFTTTTASGLPRQFQRTIDLLRKLPPSAAGEAFLGLLRIVDLFLLTLVITFVPRTRFLGNKKASRTSVHVYVVGAKEQLKEWLVDANEVEDDVAGSVNEESQFHLCELFY
jgi:hypothetical protein